MRRSFFTFILLCFSITALAQEPTNAEIKAKKIKTKKIIYESGTTMMYYYDAMGNDTAIYYNGIRNSYKVIEYNRKGNPLKITAYNDEGKEKDVTSFTYKPDGSSTAVNIDAQFKMAYYYKYDKKGNMLEFKTPDGVIRRYLYNSKGLLIKTKADSEYENERYTIDYSYNAKNKRIGSVTRGSASGSAVYEYDGKGLIKKITGTSDGITSTSTYEFGF